MYRIVGADGRQYGPVSAAQIKQWMAEGRVDSRTAVICDGAKDWTFLGLLPEFAAGASPTPPVIGPNLPQRRTNGFATAGLLCGILAWPFCCCMFPLSLLGLIFSLIALSQISRRPDLYEGQAFAIAGLVLSVVGLLLSFGAILWNLAVSPPVVSWSHFTNY